MKVIRVTNVLRILKNYLVNYYLANGIFGTGLPTTSSLISVFYVTVPQISDFWPKCFDMAAALRKRVKEGYLKKLPPLSGNPTRKVTLATSHASRSTNHFSCSYTYVYIMVVFALTIPLKFHTA